MGTKDAHPSAEGLRAEIRDFSLQVCLSTPALPVPSTFPGTHNYRSIAAFSCDLSAPNSVEVLESLCFVLPTWPSSPSIHAAIPSPPHIPTSTAVFLPAVMKTFVIPSLCIQNINTKTTSSAPGFLPAILLSSTRNKRCVSILRLF